jgi:predicted Holliday junction resolvase-like endonuclease
MKKDLSSYVMNTEELIRKLQGSNLFAECPSCGGEFKLSRSLLFDGTKPFTGEAAEKQKEMMEELKKRLQELKNRKIRATLVAENTTKAVNIGKNLEKVLPTMKDFKWELPDSRFLGDPIDLIVFNGLSADKVTSISFIEVKSGNARLNDHQKSIRDAVQEGKVKYKEFV